jgi:threonine aldolase
MADIYGANRGFEKAGREFADPFGRVIVFVFLSGHETNKIVLVRSVGGRFVVSVFEKERETHKWDCSARNKSSARSAMRA